MMKYQFRALSRNRGKVVWNTNRVKEALHAGRREKVIADKYNANYEWQVVRLKDNVVIAQSKNYSPRSA